MSKEAAVLTLRRDQFHPPIWQIWDGNGERLLATFATREMMNAALPSLHTFLALNHKDQSHAE